MEGYLSICDDVPICKELVLVSCSPPLPSSSSMHEQIWYSIEFISWLGTRWHHPTPCPPYPLASAEDFPVKRSSVLPWSKSFLSFPPLPTLSYWLKHLLQGSFTLLLQNCSQLRELEIRFHNRSDSSNDDLPSTPTQFMVWIPKWWYIIVIFIFSSHNQNEIATHGTNLISLTLRPTTEAAILFGQQCHQLTYLNMANSPSLTNEVSRCSHLLIHNSNEILFHNRGLRQLRKDVSNWGSLISRIAKD